MAPNKDIPSQPTPRLVDFLEIDLDYPAQSTLKDRIGAWLPHPVLKLYARWFARPIRQLGIAQKFGYGYAVAIGIAVIGTGMGLLVGEYYETRALKTLQLAEQQSLLLANLDRAVLGMRSHPQQLLPALGKQLWFDYESAQFQGHFTQVEKQLAALEQFAERHPNRTAAGTDQFNQVLQAYRTETNNYRLEIETLWRELDPPNLGPREVPAAQQALLQFLYSHQGTELSAAFPKLSENLAQLLNAAETQRQTTNSALESARRLQWQIVIASMVLSGLMAMGLATYISYLLVRPIKEAHRTSQQVIRESDFDLRVPVTTTDEVGSLATSLNQLIQWVGDYTEKLEIARGTLEQRVDERTQELAQTLRELQRTQTQLIQNEKMSSLGQLVAGVAHEINNPVNFIHGNLDYATSYTEDLLKLVQLYQQEAPHLTLAIQSQTETADLDFVMRDLPKLMASMRLGTERIREIVRSLRTFSRLDEAGQKSVDIHEGIESTLLILNNRLQHGIETIKEYSDLPLVDCYPAQLNQVFMNLLTNAIDAVAQQIEIAAEAGQPYEPKIWIRTRLLKANRVQVALRDNGPGIPPEILDRLFDPFFTTKDVGKGTGLGLSICYQILERHQGTVRVSSEPGKGAEFAIALPIAPTL